MVSRMVSTMLSGLVLWLMFGWTPTAAYSPRTPDRVSETDIQRLLHGVMEQLGIARPRVEYPAHQAMNLVGPQSIEGIYCVLPDSSFYHCCCSVAQLCLTVCNSMDCSTPGFPVVHY